MTKVPDRHTVAGLRGRRIGIATFSLIVTIFTAVCSVQIILQAWATAPAPEGIDCRGGLGGLVRAVHRAIRVASEIPSADREALARFRTALEPEWATRSGLTQRCRGDAEALSGLEDVDGFRYAAERALRYDVIEVASRRRRVERWNRVSPDPKPLSEP